MALILAAQVETELAKEHINVVELIRVELGNAKVLRLSTIEVPPERSFDGFRYDARIVSLGELTWSMGVSDDQSRLVSDNSDGFWTDLASTTILDFARVKAVRLFPDLPPPNNAVGSWANPLWEGRVDSYELGEDVIDIALKFGPIHLAKRALRRYRQSCDNNFADGEHCPYNPAAGKGLPEGRFQGSATGGSATTIVDSGQDFTRVENGWLVFVKSKKLVGVVRSADASGVIRVDRWRASGEPVGGDQYIVGPRFATCPLSKEACALRGMFGPNDKQADADLNTSTRRYFIGHLQPAEVRFRSLRQSEPKRGEDFWINRIAGGNRGLNTAPVPVYFGRFRAQADILGIAEAENASLGGQLLPPGLHVLMSFGEGRIYEIDPKGITVDGQGPDNPDIEGATVNTETLMIWGTDRSPGANDSSAVASGELTLDQKNQAIGSRQSEAATRFTELDTYADNPILFNETSGEGVSPAGTVMVRMTIQREGGTSENTLPSGFGRLTGLLTKMPPGSPAQRDDLNRTDWTLFPNPIQVLYWFLRNTRWGAGFDDAQLDLQAFIDESNYCQETINSTQSLLAAFTGTVGFGPDDTRTTRRGDRKDWIWLRGETHELNLRGGRLVITQAGKEFAATITNVEPVFSMPEVVFDAVRGGPFEPPLVERRQEGAFIDIDTDFPAGKVPVAGDSFRIEPFIGAPRYKANGGLDHDVDVDEMMQTILDNCNGTFIQSGGKIRPLIRKAVDLAAVDQKPVITDKGTQRNVIREGGVSTMRWRPDRLADVPHSIVVNFRDAQADWNDVSLELRDQVAEQSVAKLFNEKRRDRKPAEFSLGLTTSRDQALRLAALKLRETGLLASRLPSGTITCVMPVHDAQEIELGDVRAFASDLLPSWIRYGFITRKEDNPDKLTVAIEARPHFNQSYDDSSEDLGFAQFPSAGQTDPDTLPLPVLIESVEEEVFQDRSGVVKEHVKVKFTLP